MLLVEMREDVGCRVGTPMFLGIAVHVENHGGYCPGSMKGFILSFSIAAHCCPEFPRAGIPERSRGPPQVSQCKGQILGPGQAGRSCRWRYKGSEGFASSSSSRVSALINNSTATPAAGMKPNSSIKSLTSSTL